MKILVTGSNGTLGTALKRLVNSSGINYNWVFANRSMGDLTDAQQTQKLFQSVSPTCVVHLASKVGGVYENSQHNFDFLAINTKIHTNVMEQCKLHKVKRVINILSTCVFPHKTQSTFQESLEYSLLKSNELHNGLPHESNMGYSYSKRLLDIYGRLLANEQCQVVHISPTNLYGTGDKTSHVIPELVKKIKEAKQNQKDHITLYGSGKALRTFMSVDDLARLIIESVHTQFFNPYVHFIASPTEEVSIYELATLLCNIMEFNGTIKCDLGYSDGQLRKLTKDNEVMELFPSFKFTELKDGLTQMCKHV